jgi:hypothetical protein
MHKNIPPIFAHEEENMNERVIAVLQEDAIRGTFGFIQFKDESSPRGGVVIHTFSTGKFAEQLLIHYWGNKHFYTVISRDVFKPSRDAYFCEGSYVEPMWEGDSCRCTNYFAKEYYSIEGDKLVKQSNGDCATNILTDEEALKVYGPFVGEYRVASNVSLTDALTAASNVLLTGCFDVLGVEHNKEFAGFKIVPAGQTGCI